MRKSKIAKKALVYASCLAMLGSFPALADEVRRVEAFDFATISEGPVADAANAGAAATEATNAESTSETSGTSEETGDDALNAWRAMINSPERAVPLPTGYHFNEHKAYSYNDLSADLTALAATYPSMGYSSLGQTVDGRELYLIRVGNENASKKIFVSAAIHGREYITTQLVMRQVASLLEMQRSNASFEGKSVNTMLENTAIYFVPMANPDGVSIVQYGLDGIGSEEIRDNIRKMAERDNATDLDAYLLRWKSNANGVNLNKNFDANWEICNDRKGYPSRDEYKGTSAESEIETKAIADFIRNNGITHTISYHTQGKVLFWYFGEGAYVEAARQLVEIVSKNSRYVISDYYSENDAGGLKDWAEQKLGLPSVTVECGIGVSPVEETQIEEIWDGQKGVLPELMGTL